MADNTKRPRLEEKSNCYDIYRSNAKRLVLTVINREFPEGIPNRKAFIDSKYNVFSEFFGFESCTPSYGKDQTHFVHNASKDALVKELDVVKKKLEEEEISCLAVILSSHGEEQMVSGNREHFFVCSDGQTFRTLAIIEKLKTKKDIPMIFIIQACRHAGSDSPQGGANSQTDDSQDRGVSIMLVDCDSDTENEGFIEDITDRDQPRGTNYREKPSLIPACVPHTSVLFSSSEGKKSYINSSEGSWILCAVYDEVCKMMEEKEAEISLFDLFTRVNREMSKKETQDKDDPKKAGLKSASSFLHQMPKKLVLKVQDINYP